MKLLTNVVTLVDPADELDALAKLCDMDGVEARREWRRREHRREKKMNMAVNVGFITVLVACAFIIGYCVGGW